MESYKGRFIQEFKQLKDRRDKLGVILDGARDGLLDFELSCPVELLGEQYQIMSEYLDILSKRADIEKIDLS